MADSEEKKPTLEARVISVAEAREKKLAIGNLHPARWPEEQGSAIPLAGAAMQNRQPIGGVARGVGVKKAAPLDLEKIAKPGEESGSSTEEG